MWRRRRNEFFDKVEKEEIAKIVGARGDKKFVTQKKISHVVEKGSEVMGKINGVTQNWNEVEIFYFMGIE